MYKPLFTALFLTLLTTTARAQPCWPDGIQIQSQFDVDNLASLSQGCSSVAGSVTISGPNITNLDSLSWITAIDGNLWIYMNPALTSLQGLSNLVSVSGTVNLFGNGSLENLAGLNNLPKSARCASRLLSPVWQSPLRSAPALICFSLSKP